MIDHERFDELWSKWQRVKEQEADKQAQKVASWEASFRMIEAEYYELRADGAWISGPSSVLGIIGQSRRETYHCRFLAWLMDSTGRHRLGHRFLERLLGVVAPDRAYETRELTRAVPKCEVVAPNCRADIVVTGFSSTLVIEAKVDDEEQPEQCNRVFEDFAGEPEPYFVFLTPFGRQPQTATGEAASAFHTLSFGECLEILRGTIDDSGLQAGDIATASVRSYLRTLEEEFET